MLSYLFAFFLYILTLSILTVFICIYIYYQKKKTSKRINEINIFNYLKGCEVFYQQLISEESALNSQEKKIIKLLFDDVNKLSKKVDRDNIGVFLNQVRIQEEKNSSFNYNPEKIHNEDIIFNLIRKKANLILMIICHNLNVYNAERILHDPTKEANEVLKRIDHIIEFENRIPSSNKRNKKRNYYEDIRKDITTDLYKDSISKSKKLAVA